jgi:hypothetical protein
MSLVTLDYYASDTEHFGSAGKMVEDVMDRQKCITYSMEEETEYFSDWSVEAFRKALHKNYLYSNFECNQAI